MRRHTVLVVDDDEDFADGVSEILELAGYDVTIAPSGEAGAEACAAGGVDAALIDIGLPRMNGVECLSRIRRLLPDIPAFLLTGYGEGRLTRQGREAGATAVLNKPVDPERLLDLLARTLGR